MLGSAPPLFESVEAIDQELARLARSSGALRFELGAGLDALARSGGHHELGFSSLEAYALERCERSARWVQESRALARRLEELPALRRALMTGEISFSMAQVVGKLARAEDERAWLAEAEVRTVREMRLLVREHATRTSTASEHNRAPPSELTGDELLESSDEERTTLTVTVDREDVWLFECARMLGRQVWGLDESETIEALLGEGTSSLLTRVRRDAAESLKRDGFADFDDSDDDLAQRQWEAQLERWREEAEARCEASILERTRACADGAESLRIRGEFAAEGSERDASALDGELRRIAHQLSKRDLEFGRLADALWKADGWRRLGYATAAQYARERLGTSLSSIKARRGLARRVEQMPQLSAALETAQVGYEAARLVASVATRETVAEWLARASVRTVRFLREEVDAMKLFARVAPGSMTSPPSEETMQALEALESRIVSGALFRAVDDGQMSAGVPQQCRAGAQRRSSLFRDSAASRAARHRGRVTLRFRLSAETRRYYRWLERLFARCGPPRVSFLRFLCCALIEAWKHALGSTVKYAQVYERDRYRCVSPVCGRREVTPHHIRFRSAGGDESSDNLASLCVWCHLQGIHGGRLHARPPASDIRWSIGRMGHTQIWGRRRVAPQTAAHRMD